MLLPLTILGIIHLTTLFSSALAFPDAFTNSNAELSSSVILTIVALLGPLLVTTIVKLTKSPTLAFPITSECLTTVRLTTGLTVMFVLLSNVVLFSFAVAAATLVNVPFVFTLTSTQIVTEVPLRILRLFQTTTLLTSALAFPEAFTNSNTGFNTSVTLTPVALAEPVLFTVISNLTTSPTLTTEALADLVIFKITVPAVTFSLEPLVSVSFSLDLANATLLKLPSLTTRTIKTTEAVSLTLILLINQVTTPSA